MRHAFNGRSDQRISWTPRSSADRIVLRLHHLGQSYDPEAVRPPAFDGSQDGGFGMYIVSQSVDEVRYHRDERGRRLHLDDQEEGQPGEPMSRCSAAE